MGLFDKLFGKKTIETIEVVTEKNIIYLPIEGEIIPLEDIGDGVFSEGILGKGCGIKPKEEKVYAPINGTVENVADTKHAIGIMSDDGAEVLIHVGMDTVDMKGTGFDVLVEVGQKVKCGELIMKFDTGKIKAAGHPSTTALVLTNTDDLNAVTILNTGDAAKLTPVLKVE